MEVLISYTAGGVRYRAGIGRWGGSSVNCDAEIPADVYDTIEEGLRNGEMSGDVVVTDSATTWHYETEGSE